MGRVERVVYILGAGFSAPLGIPVMSEFMRKARDLSEEYPDKYAQYKRVFDEIEGLRVAASRIGVDPDNIEDVLSVFAMTDAFTGTQSTDMYGAFVTQVIKDCTPDWLRKTANPQHPVAPHIIGAAEPWRHYLAFRFAIEGLSLFMRSNVAGALERPPTGVEYSAITLNYDMVLETSFDALCKLYGAQSSSLRIAKLHGSVGDLSVVPPTWNKALHSASIKGAWKTAFDAISSAHQIRIVGYSFPPTDPYMRYLLASALRNNAVLKQVDMICLDPAGDVQARFDKTIAFARRRFLSGLTEDYLRNVGNYVYESDGTYSYAGVEDAHEDFMRAPKA